MTAQSFRIHTNDIAQNLLGEGNAVVNAGMFGGISATRTPGEAQGFEDAFLDIGLTHIRWPGGTLAERGVIHPGGNITFANQRESPAPFNDDGLPLAYSFDYPELLHPDLLMDDDGDPTGMLGLSDQLAFAVEQNASMSIISPTLRYRDDPGQGREELYDFLVALFVDGEWNDGILPDEMIIDIGNENYETQAIVRALISQLGAVQDFRDDYPDVDFLVAVQAGRAGPEATADALAFSESIGTLPEQGLRGEIDLVRMHQLRQGHFAHTNFENGGKAESLQALIDAINANRELTGATDRSEVGVYISAWSTTARDIDPDLELAMPNAGATLSLFSGFAELGVDYAAVWGLAIDNVASAPISSFPDPETGAQVLTPNGEVLRQMAEILPGMSLIDHPDLDAGRNVPVNLYPYVDSTKAVLFFSANELPEDEWTVTGELTDFGDISNAWAESIYVEDGVSGVPIIGAPGVTVDGSQFAFTMSSDFEVVRLVLTRGDPGHDPAWMQAAPGVGEELRGGSGNNLLIGNSGNDTLIGGAGDDTLISGSGNNLLQGGDGDDLLALGSGTNTGWGGDGADLFVVDPAGSNVIADFAARDGDQITFGGRYESVKEIEENLSKIDHSGSGAKQDLLIQHPGQGATVILGGAEQLDEILASIITGDAGQELFDVYLAEADPAETVDVPDNADLPWRTASQESQEAASDDEDDEDAQQDREATGASASCFVATAAYGDPIHSDVVCLRLWRDAVLTETPAGRAFVAFYWIVGPHLARLVRPGSPIGRGVRWLIARIVRYLTRNLEQGILIRSARSS